MTCELGKRYDVMQIGHHVDHTGAHGIVVLSGSISALDIEQQRQQLLNLLMLVKKKRKEEEVASLRLLIATRQPSAARVWAVAKPRPREGSKDIPPSSDWLWLAS